MISPVTFTLISEKWPLALQVDCSYTSGMSRPLLPLTRWEWSISLPDPPPHPRSHWTGTWLQDRGELCYRRLRTWLTPWLRPSIRPPMVESSLSVNLLSYDRKDFIIASAFSCLMIEKLIMFIAFNFSNIVGKQGCFFYPFQCCNGQENLWIPTLLLIKQVLIIGLYKLLNSCSLTSIWKDTVVQLF